MGQYYAAVNTDKKEYICPWCIGAGAKLWEWAANPTGAIFTLLLRQSTATGGGDIQSYHPQSVDVGNQSADEIAHTIRKIASMEGRAITLAADAIPGRWAGDPVALVGDYDDSGLWEDLYTKKSYQNISQQLVAAWNDFIEIEANKLQHCLCTACGGHG